MTTTYYDSSGNAYKSTRPSGPKQTERVPGIPEDIFTDPITGADYDVTPGYVSSNVDTGDGSGGGGGYGGGGGGASRTLNNYFIDWFGYEPSDLLATAQAEGWTEDDVRRAAVEAGADGFRMQQARLSIRQAVAAVYGDPAAIPDSLVDSIIGDGFWNDQDYLRNTYFPMTKQAGIDVTQSPAAKDFVDYWIAQTGKPLTYTATLKLQEMIATYGFTQDGMNAWETWVPTTQSAITGNYGANRRATINDIYSATLGRNATAAELDPTGSLWNLSDAAMMEQLRGTPEYQSIYAGKPAYMSEAEYIDYAKGLSWVYTMYYGPSVDVTTLKGATAPVAPDTPYVPTAATPAPAWKSLTAETFAQELGKVGITAEGGTYYKTLGDGTRQEVAYEDLMNYLPQGQFWKDDRGYHYVQDAGAIDPSTGKPISGVGAAPAPTSTTPATSAADFSRWNIGNLTPEEVAAAIASGYTPDQIWQQFQWHEQANYLEGTSGATLTEAYGTSFSHEDWENIARGGEGSGALRAKMVEAQNRVAFREAYRLSMGRDPSPSDYDWLTQNFVSPSEFITTRQAEESADEMYPEVADLMQRVYGESISKDQLKDMALGRPGSGELKAMINQASKLDEYRWIHKQYYDGEPTPEDYAKYAGYASPAELQWEIVTTEKMSELGPDIKEAWTRAYSEDLSDDDLWTLLGKQEGYGELAYKLKEAEEENKKKDIATLGAHEATKTAIAYKAAERGGFAEALPGLASLN